MVAKSHYHDNDPWNLRAAPTAATTAAAATRNPIVMNDVMDDAMKISQSFRAAMDEDVREVMNAQSKLLDVGRLNFYAVPYKWLKDAWPFLQGDEQPTDDRWRENLGKIEMEGLCRDSNNSTNLDTIMVAAADDRQQAQQKSAMLGELKRMSNKKNKVVHETPTALGPGAQQRMAKPKLHPLMEHGSDFFLLGENTWTLLKSKFGYDFDVQFKCFVDTNPSVGNEHILAVRVHEPEDDAALPNQLKMAPDIVPIPASGRFPYEQWLGNEPLSSNHASISAATGVASRPGNVSDDEHDGKGDDLYPSLDSNGGSQPILLLPASTTQMEFENNSTNDRDGNSDNEEGVKGTPRTATVKRRYGSGLGNLGNTCFMNCSIQCLGHTGPLRSYFLSGAYEQDLNRDNPLGTGGELATQFAQLLGEMWGTRPASIASSSFAARRNYGMGSSTDSLGNVVYPRSFKVTLGKHAEQFVGYDQHDSQELATYLLDALHEDTNRVSKKPYVEKPEQGEDETDEEAAEKAWNLHLQRENSRVMDNFMGLVKSHVKCSEPGCGRVSTTFDPFMFLSVPIPGSSERSLVVTFVPLDPLQRPKKLAITLCKAATVGDLLKKLIEEVNKHNPDYESLMLEDVCAVDIWEEQIYEWYDSKEEIDKIRDTDKTYVYQLRPLADIQKIEKDHAHAVESEKDGPISTLGPPLPKRYRLDRDTLLKFSNGSWDLVFQNYIQKFTHVTNAFNQRRGDTEERIKIYKRLVKFIESCQKEVEVDSAGQKRAREENGDDEFADFPSKERIDAVADSCDKSQFFAKVESIYDLAVLEEVAKRMREEIVRLERVKREAHPDGLRIEVRMKVSGYNTTDDTLLPPFVLRVPSNMTVYSLREELAARLAHSLKSGHDTSFHVSSGQPTSETESFSVTEGRDLGEDVPLLGASGDSSIFGAPETMILRQVPLMYDRKSTFRSDSSFKRLGSLEKAGIASYDGARQSKIASRTHGEEQELISEMVGDLGKVCMEWPSELAERAFDREMLEMVEVLTDEPSGRAKKFVSVLDCIEKYCQMEQLEESEMWYCNKCKKHVRAWKQFHLYKGPPILIIHLKRFHYSATSHRRDKIGMYIDFPLEDMDLTDHVIHWNENEKPLYDCYAVTNHYGGLGGGHYTAYALNDDGVWCYYDDSRITPSVDPKDVVSDAAYVLYYRRKDVPRAEEFSVDMQTSGERQYGPTLVLEDKVQDHDASEVSSNAAMVGDEQKMDVEDTDLASQATSLGSMQGPGDSNYLADDLDYGVGTQNDVGGGFISGMPSQ